MGFAYLNHEPNCRPAANRIEHLRDRRRGQRHRAPPLTWATTNVAGSATLLPQGLAKGMYVVRASPRAIRLSMK